MDAVCYQFNKYMGDWTTTGAVFELRIYGIDYDDLRPLKNKIKNETLFGQQLSINDETNYSKWNMTFNSKPDELLDFVLDNAAFVKKSNIYGRLISFKLRVNPNDSPNSNSNSNPNAAPNSNPNNQNSNTNVNPSPNISPNPNSKVSPSPKPNVTPTPTINPTNNIRNK